MLIAFASFLLTLLMAPRHIAVEFVVIVVLAAPWIWLCARRPGKRVWYWRAGAVDLAAVIALVLVWTPWQPPAPAPVGTRARAIKFIPPPEPVPHCVTITGVGDIPPGHALVLLDRPTDPGGYYTPTSGFSFDGRAAPTAGGWSAKLNLGSGDASDQGAHIAVVALLVTDETADLFTAEAQDGSGLLPGNPLDHGAPEDRLITTRNAQTTHC